MYKKPKTKADLSKMSVVDRNRYEWYRKYYQKLERYKVNGKKAKYLPTSYTATTCNTI